MIPAARRATVALPAEPGVYRFRDDRGRVIYLGRATDLRSRVRSYWGELRGRGHLRRMVPQIASVEALVCGSVHEAAWLERNLLERSLPRWNRTRGGQEVPAWIVLDPDARHPALRLAFGDPPPGRDAGSPFGPFLGAERARLTLSGLLRAWPVHLTGSTPVGTEAAFADVRGTGPADLGPFVARITAALGGAPDALTTLDARLTELRDAAAARLAFETAAAIEAERTALTWLATPQRVTGCSPDDLVVRGWCDGLLVTLSASGGRLDRWRSERVPGVRGEALAASTPAEWRAFARRNAELAARLASAPA